jgi:outer membrane protein assembly factor BamE (lipoprotein component of BamABCDE complex)
MTNFKLFATVIIAVSLIGCGTTGNTSLKSENESTISKKIQIGKTTKTDIHNMFGSPLSSSFDGGLLVWNYELDDTSMDMISIPSLLFTLGLAGTRHSGTRKQLTILFDDDSVVKKMNMSESPVSTGTMLMK